MNSTTPDRHPTADELSAHLDHPDQEVAGHVSDCQSCSQDLGRLRRVSHALSETLPVDAETRTRAIATALDQLEADPPKVASIAARRRRTGWLAGMGAAAAVALGAILAVGTLGDLRSSDEGASTTGLRAAPETATDDAFDGGAGPGDTALEAPSSNDDPPAVALVDLGPTENLTQVRAALARLRQSATAGLTGEEPATCEPQARRLPGLPELAELQVAATSAFGGIPSVVLGFAGVSPDEGGTRDSPVVTVLALDGCRELARSVAP